MTDQQKIYRVFRLIQLLSQPPYRTVKRLAEVLETTPRTVYRYIQLLESLGYQIDKKEGDRYFLQIEFTPTDKLIDTEEAGFLQDLLWQAPASHPLRDRLLHKLNKQYVLAPLVQSQPRLAVHHHIRNLAIAIENNRRAVLLNYYAPSSGSLGHRRVEPVEFKKGYTYLWAYDLDKKAYRQFKLDRIGEVELLDEPVEGDHESHAFDLFGWAGSRWLPVRLNLSGYAHKLLLEEFPDALPFVRTHKGQAIFDGMVRDWRGIGRFILGLPGEIEVVEPEELKEYLRKRVREGGMFS
jgi:proteasome accessory factor C